MVAWTGQMEARWFGKAFVAELVFWVEVCAFEVEVSVAGCCHIGGLSSLGSTMVDGFPDFVLQEVPDQ